VTGAGAAEQSLRPETSRSAERKANADDAPLLAVDDLTIRFGGIVALDRVSFDVAEGSILGLIGPNGAGKTTFFNILTRLYRADSGDVRFQGKSLLRIPAHQIVNLGIARTFQNVELCTRMTVLDNVLLGCHHKLATNPANFLLAGFGWPGLGGREKHAVAEAEEVLEFVGLSGFGSQVVQGLPFGALKAVELARALVAKPRLLLLDEPAGGLNTTEVAELGRLIRRINQEFKLTVLVVEHHMNLVMAISDKVVVLDFGSKIAEGTAREVQEDKAVIEAYLGADEDD
jgi:branched-chain amino acid transport system ATP-binding protein